MNTERVKKAFNENRPSTEMTEQEIMVLMVLILNKDSEINKDVNLLDKESETYKELKPLIESFLAKVFMGRINNMTSLKISLGVLIMLLYYMESAGECVMYSYYLHLKLKPNTFVDLNVFSMELFPMGMFSKEQLNKIWDAQKVTKDDLKLLQGDRYGAPDNLIDYSETWKK